MEVRPAGRQQRLLPQEEGASRSEEDGQEDRQAEDVRQVVRQVLRPRPRQEDLQEGVVGVRGGGHQQ